MTRSPRCSTRCRSMRSSFTRRPSMLSRSAEKFGHARLAARSALPRPTTCLATSAPMPARRSKAARRRDASRRQRDRIRLVTARRLAGAVAVAAGRRTDRPPTSSTAIRATRGAGRGCFVRRRERARHEGSGSDPCIHRRRQGRVTPVLATPDDAEPLGAMHVQAWRETYVGLVPQHVLDDLDPVARARMWRRRSAARRAFFSPRTPGRSSASARAVRRAMMIFRIPAKSAPSTCCAAPNAAASGAP